MDLFDLTLPAINQLGLNPAQRGLFSAPPSPAERQTVSKSHPPPANPSPYFPDLVEGLRPLTSIPTLVLGVQSDILFPVEQQRELVDGLRMAGNSRVSYFELGGVWGHDTFL